MTQPIIAHRPNCKASILQIGPDRQTWEPKVKEAAARILLDRHFTRIGTVYYRLIVALEVVGGQKVKTADRVEVLEAPDFPQLNGLFTVSLAMIDTETLDLELVITKL
jgi:hypothetical protein